MSHLKKRKAPWVKIVIAVASILGVLVLAVGIAGFFLIYMPYLRIKAKADLVVAEAKGMQDEFKKNDIELVAKKLDAIATKYKDFEKESQSIYWAASIVPQIKDFKSGVEAGRYMIHAGQESVKAIEPYADLIGFSKKKNTGNFYTKSSEERLQTAVLTLDKMLQKIDVVSSDVAEAEKRINSIDPNRYPETLAGKKVRSNVVLAKDSFEGVKTLFVDAKPLLVKLPEILGAKKEQTYLILFQNTAERRATGGFLTFYAVFKIEKGKLKVEKSSDIYDIDAQIGSHPPAPDKIKMYHKDVNQFYLRDSNLSPDLVESIKLFSSLYEKAGNKVKYDGIIMLDSKILVDMLNVFGDTQANGVNFSSQPDKRCYGCPQVIYQLTSLVDTQVGHVVANRKGIVGELMYQLMFKALGFSPSKYWGKLAETMFRNLDEKHIQLYFVDPSIQAAVEKLNYAGRVRDYDGDYLNINNVNFAGAKSNLFITETINSETTLSSGEIKRKVTMEFKNPYPASNCSLKQEAVLCLNATLRNWMRVYVPKGSKLINFKGSETKVLTYDELGKTVFEGFMKVNPEGKAAVTVEYTLPASIKKDNYKLLIQKQAGNEKQTLKVDVDGQKKFEGNFNTDKEIK